MKKKIAIIVITIFLIGFFVGFVFRSNFNIVNPIEPVKRVPVSNVSPTPVKNQEESALPDVFIEKRTPDTLEFEMEENIAKIRVIESGNCNAIQGHHRFCEDKGMRNCIGYGVHDDFCFDDKDDETESLNNWLTPRLAKRPLPDVLCEYNLGTTGLLNCAYYQKFLAAKI